jgi:hypothetical protein
VPAALVPVVIVPVVSYWIISTVSRQHRRGGQADQRNEGERSDCKLIHHVLLLSGKESLHESR